MVSNLSSKLLLVAACVVVFGLGISMSQKVYAGGGVGSGGSGGGGTGGGQKWGWTPYGHGWAMYDINGGGPTDGFRSGTWGNVKRVCGESNAQKVAIYIMGTGGGAPFRTPTGKYMGYDDKNYRGMWGGGGGVDNGRANKISRGTAKSYFDSLGRYGVDTSGYRWGSNVSWFCWDFRLEWNLIPRLSGVVPGSKVSVDSTIGPITPTVENNDDGESPGDTKWVVGRMVIPPGGANPPGADSNNTSPSDRYGSRWDRVRNGDRSFPANRTITLPSDTYANDSLAIGSKVCWTLSVSPPKRTGNNWRHASPLCVVIVPQPIRPQVQILGYDARLAGTVKTTLSRQLRTTTNYGSWAEYGVLSSNRNNNFSSSAGLKLGGTADQSDWSMLTFANRQSSGSACASNRFGCATHPNRGVSYPQAFIHNMRSRCPTPITNNNITIPALSNTTSTQFFCTNGTATISQDITYSDASTASANTLPQVVIIANDIVVDSNVTRIDAWLLAGRATGTSSTGRISTCSGMFTGGGASVNRFPAFGSISQAVFYARKNDCTKPLVVNGPVASKQLFLYRTTSPQDADKNLDQNLPPAERFNLRADAFLWAFNGGTSTPTDPVAQTVSIKELPPRF